MANLLHKLGLPSFGNLSVEQRAGLFGVGWTTLGQVGILAVRTVSLLVLNQLLSKADYGIFGTAFAAQMIIELLSDIGMRPAIIRHADGEKSTFIATAWMIILMRGLMLAGATILMALLLPQFYSDFDPKLLFNVLLALSIRPIIHAFGNPMAILLQRHMRFDRWSLLEFGQTVGGTCVTLICAYIFRNVWAVVAGTLVGELTFVLLTYALCRRPPLPKWNASAARELSHFGNQIFYNTLVMALWIYVDRLVGPVFLSAPEMGIYIVSWNLMETVERFGTKAIDVYYSALTKLTDLEKQTSFHFRICRRLALFGMPLLAAGVLIAPWVVIILHEEFREVGPVFVILMARVMFRLLGQVQFQLLLARTEVRAATQCYWIAFFIQIGLIVPLTRHFGVIGIAYSVLISTAVQTLAQNIVLARRWGMSLESFFITSGYAAVALAAVKLLYH